MPPKLFFNRFEQIMGKTRNKYEFRTTQRTNLIDQFIGYKKKQSDREDELNDNFIRRIAYLQKFKELDIVHMMFITP